MYKLYEKAERNIFFLADSKVLLVIQYIDRSSHRSCSIKKLFLKFLQCSQENTPVQTSRPAISINSNSNTGALHEKCLDKKFFLVRIQSKNIKIRIRKKLCIWTLFTQWVFSCEYCEFSKNIYFEKHLQSAASGKKVIKG